MGTSRIAVVVGFVVKSPVAGMAAYNFHYIAGLRDLGYEVHYVERLNSPDECYDPGRDAFGDDPGYGPERASAGGSAGAGRAARRRQLRFAQDQLADAGVKVLIFSGGEPLMRPDLLPLIARARERGLDGGRAGCPSPGR